MNVGHLRNFSSGIFSLTLKNIDGMTKMSSIHDKIGPKEKLLNRLDQKIFSFFAPKLETVTVATAATAAATAAATD